MSDIERLQGTWQQVGYERDGIAEPLDEQGWKPRTTFEGSTFTVTLADGSIYIKGTIALDSTRSPKSMDMTDTFGPEAGQTLLAIYSLEGDRFVFCAAYPGLDRPTEFRTRQGQVMRIMQREGTA
jgi:uncharacterized protein (TIGR03067 family)